MRKKETDTQRDRQPTGQSHLKGTVRERQIQSVRERERERVARFIQERKTSKQGRHERAYLVWK